MKKGFLAIALLLSVMVSAFGSNSGGRPRWITDVPVASNNTFEYKVIVIHASNSSEARALVPREMTHYVETSHNVQITSVSKIDSENINGNVSDHTSFNMMAVVEGDPVNIVVKIIDEYYEGNGSQTACYFLCAVGNPKASKINFDKVQITDKYGVRGLWRSAICPGWGQIYKGSKGKGIAILGAEVVALGGVVAFESMRSSYVTKAKTQPQFAQKYYARATNCKNIRNGFIAGAAAVYVYNLIDAIAAPGSRWVKTQSSGFAFYPTVTNESVGLAFSYSF